MAKRHGARPKGGVQKTAEPAAIPWGPAAGAALAGLLVYLACAGGLFYRAEWLQLPLVVGVTVGLLSPGRASAALLGGSAFVLGMAIAMPSVTVATYRGGTAAIALVAMIALAALTAVAARWVADLVPDGSSIAVAAMSALLAVNLLVTALAVAAMPMRGTETVLQGLARVPVEGTRMPDDDVYLLAQHKMAQGQGFYGAYASAHAANTAMRSVPPGSVFGFRPPLVFLVRDLVGGPPSVRFLGSLFVLAVAAAGVAAAFLRGFGRTPLALVTVAALAAYSLYWLTQSVMTYPDGWAGMLGLISFALVLAALGRPPSRGLFGAGVAFAVLAVLSRELLAFLPLAGLASAALSKEDRRFRLGAWLAGAGAIAAGLAAHYRLALPLLSSGQEGVSFWFKGGPRKLLLALEYATRHFAASSWTPLLFAVLGVAGAVLLVSRSERGTGVFVAMAVALPLVGFLFFGNPSHEASGVATNYWGVIVVPLLYALVPAAFGFLPGVLPDAGASGSSAGRRGMDAS